MNLLLGFKTDTEFFQDVRSGMDVGPRVEIDERRYVSRGPTGPEEQE